MNTLLTGDLFDSFLLEEASVTTAVTTVIDGRLNKDFFSAEEWENRTEPYEFTTWHEMRSLCFQLIKGKRTPLRFRFVLQLFPKAAEAILQKGGRSDLSNLLKAFVLTIRYDGEKALLCTGVSFTTFVADKEADKLWDAALKQYLTKKEIAYEEL